MEKPGSKDHFVFVILSVENRNFDFRFVHVVGGDKEI